MLIKVAVKRWYDWRPAKVEDVKPEDVTVPSILGEGFLNVQELHDTPSETTIVIPDSEIDRMVADHTEGMRLRRQGYEAKHVGHGGPVPHGRLRVVAAQPAPLKSRKQLIGDHLAEAVMPLHAPPEAIGRVKVLDAVGWTEPERKDLERYLTVRLGG